MTKNDKKMPALFIGHGNPMNAIEENEFSEQWALLGQRLPKPKAIVCISAHWETRGSCVTAMPNPKTIHDFGGFPKAMYEVQYPAPGDTELAKEIIVMAGNWNIKADADWGLDHGCWSILCRMYPKAGIPVVQLSLDREKTAKEHYAFARSLYALREKEVLIIGSGNIVHNLRLVEWQNPEGAAWAVMANSLIKKLIEEEKHEKLMDYQQLGKEVQMAIPTAEHYLPLLYVLALKQADEEVSFFNDKIVMGSLAMTSVMVKQLQKF